VKAPFPLTTTTLCQYQRTVWLLSLLITRILGDVQTTRILNFRNGGAKTPEGYPGPGSLQECKIVPNKGANIMLAAQQEQLFS